MQIFLDSANFEEIQQICKLGIISGITTNPSLMAKTSGNFHDTIAQICNLLPEGDISVEVSASELDEMILEGNKLIDIADNIVIKLPMTWNGIRTCKHFSMSGIKTNMTLCFSVNQAIVAAIAGATYISPFVGRLEDIGHDGMDLLASIKLAYNNYSKNINTKILAASIRNVNHFYKISMIGADVITMPGKVITQLIEHPLTSKGLDIFDQDWKNSSHKI